PTPPTGGDEDIPAARETLRSSSRGGRSTLQSPASPPASPSLPSPPPIPQTTLHIPYAPQEPPRPPPPTSCTPSGAKELSPGPPAPSPLRSSPLLSPLFSLLTSRLSSCALRSSSHPLLSPVSFSPPARSRVPARTHRPLSNYHIHHPQDLSPCVCARVSSSLRLPKKKKKKKKGSVGPTALCTAVPGFLSCAQLTSF
ncbi:unnamed protein product, partial [Rangifer tarandus platyrhynchus]